MQHHHGDTSGAPGPASAAPVTQLCAVPAAGGDADARLLERTLFEVCFAVITDEQCHHVV